MDREAVEAMRTMLTAHPVGHVLTEEDEAMDALYNELCDLALKGLERPYGDVRSQNETQHHKEK